MSELEALKDRLEAENVYLQEEIRTQHNFNEIVGNSPPLLRGAAPRRAGRADSNRPCCILGETGTGKELFARAIHGRSRARRPAAREGQLRRDRARPGRERAVRARQGRLHRRDRQARRAVRARRRRHHPPRRDRRAAARGPGQAAARPAGAGVRAGRQQPHRSRRRPRDRRDEPQPRSTPSGRARSAPTCSTG